MAGAMSGERLPHLIVTGRDFFGTEKYTAAPRGGGPAFSVPARDRTLHGTSVREQLEQARGENAAVRGVAASEADAAPIPIEVRSEPGFLLKLEGLEDKRKGIEVACVQTDGEVQVATVHVPEGALTHFLKRAEEYLSEDTKGTDKTPAKPKHRDLISTIGQIRLATLRSFWTDDLAEFPPSDQKMWWETWVRVVGGQDVWDSFRLLATSLGLTVGTDTIRFPDRVVGLVYGSADRLMASADLLDMIGEVRRAKENPADYLSLPPKDQAEFVESLLARVERPNGDAPYVCVLDGGMVINPLIAPALDPADCHRYDPSWPVADAPGRALSLIHAHGTEMAGVVLYGRHLAALLSGDAPHAVACRLESVRILPPKPYQNERRLYGAITAQAVSRVEIAAPDRVRSFCMAITTDGRDRGRPSSWSGVIDQICGGYADQNPRLFFISAGNTDPNERHRYPESNDTDTVQDPGQAWNAITVGACTDCVTFDQAKFPGHVPIAPAGDLSPSSTTSLTWEKPWPYKPDFVLEGGNQIARANSVLDPDDMTMLTAAHATSGALLTDFRDTSAATAQAAGMAAALQAEYPRLWPETIRGLLIHSAEWTEPMRRAFGEKKADHANRLRRYGYGIPNLARARDSARDALTLVVEKTIRPFTKEGSDIKTNEMGLHALPWPKEQLSELGEARVTLRVTLSYFIEPKPGRREGFVKHRHRYQSHGLRFEVKRPQETLDDLRKRVSQAARAEEEEFEAVGDTFGWELGPKLRTRGSVHCDWWTGTAADLANCGVIAVYPVSGWWRESKGNDWSKEARYALLVSIRTDAVSVPVSLFTPTAIDIYTPVQTTIAAAVEQLVPTEIEGIGEDD